MNNEIANQDTENTAKNVKSSEETMEVIKKMEKIIRSNKYIILWLAYQQVQIFEKFKLNDDFINMANQFGISAVINTINEIMVVLTIYEKKRLFRPLHTKMKFSIKNFLVNMAKSTFSCVFGKIC